MSIYPNKSICTKYEHNAWKHVPIFGFLCAHRIDLTEAVATYCLHLHMFFFAHKIKHVNRLLNTEIFTIETITLWLMMANDDRFVLNAQLPVSIWFIHLCNVWLSFEIKIWLFHITIHDIWLPHWMIHDATNAIDSWILFIF